MEITKILKINIKGGKITGFIYHKDEHRYILELEKADGKYGSITFNEEEDGNILIPGMDDNIKSASMIVNFSNFVQAISDLFIEEQCFDSFFEDNILNGIGNVDTINVEIDHEEFEISFKENDSI